MYRKKLVIRWQRHLYRLRVWYNAVRPFSYAASIVPVLVGTAIAWHSGQIRWMLFTPALLGSIAIQCGTNLVNEYFDYVQGVDKQDSMGPAGVILRGELSPKEVLWAGVFAFAIGSASGLYIVSQVGWPILAVGLASVLAGWFYTAKPLALGYRGLGEPEVFFFMGPVMVMGTYYVHTRSLAWAPFLVSIPIGLLVMAILHANNMRDVMEDADRGRVTWVVLTCRLWGLRKGKEISRWIYYAVVVGTYVALIALVGTGNIPIIAFLTLVTLPLAIKLIMVVGSQVEGRSISVVVRGTARLHMLFGVVLALAYVLDLIIWGIVLGK